MRYQVLVLDKFLNEVISDYEFNEVEFENFMTECADIYSDINNISILVIDREFGYYDEIEY